MRIDDCCSYGDAETEKKGKVVASNVPTRTPIVVAERLDSLTVVISGELVRDLHGRDYTMDRNTGGEPGLASRTWATSDDFDIDIVIRSKSDRRKPGRVTVTAA